MAKLTVHLIQLKQEKFAETTFSRLRLKVNWKRIFKHIFYIPPNERGFIINLIILDLFFTITLSETLDVTISLSLKIRHLVLISLFE